MSGTNILQVYQIVLRIHYSVQLIIVTIKFRQNVYCDLSQFISITHLRHTNSIMMGRIILKKDVQMIKISNMHNVKLVTIALRASHSIKHDGFIILPFH